MNFKAFKDQALTLWEGHYKRIADIKVNGIRTIQNGLPVIARINDSIFFPTIVFFIRYKNYYVCEFSGVSNTLQELHVIERNLADQDIHQHLNQFKGDTSNALLELNNETSIVHMFYANVDMSEIEERFPTIRNSERTISIRSSSSGQTISVPDGTSSFSIQDTIFVNKQDSCVRTRFILNLLVVKSTVQKNELQRMFEFHTQHGPNFNMSRGALRRKTETTESIVLSQFQNLYLLPGLHETSIGKFLDKHSALIHKGFATDNYIYEPTLKWLAPSDQPRKDINPDLMIQRADKYYDIIDLKTGELFTKSLVVGERERRKLSAKAMEGVAQLANYREYFTHTDNAEYARAQFGITVKKPKLILVIGTLDNLDDEKLIAACRMFLGEDFTIMNYDTLVAQILL